VHEAASLPQAASPDPGFYWPARGTNIPAPSARAPGLPARPERSEIVRVCLVARRHMTGVVDHASHRCESVRSGELPEGLRSKLSAVSG